MEIFGSPLCSLCCLHSNDPLQTPNVFFLFTNWVLNFLFIFALCYTLQHSAKHTAPCHSSCGVEQFKCALNFPRQHSTAPNMSCHSACSPQSAEHTVVVRTCSVSTAQFKCAWNFSRIFLKSYYQKKRKKRPFINFVLISRHFHPRSVPNMRPAFLFLSNMHV